MRTGTVKSGRRGRLWSAAVALIGIAAVGLVTACGTGASPAAGTAGGGGPGSGHLAATPGGTISEHGSTLLEPLMDKWASDYHQQFPTVTVQPSGGGSTQGINEAASGQVAIGASDAYLSSGDVFLHPSLLNIPVAISAQAIIYNVPGLPKNAHVQLSGTILAQMYSGQITRWNDSQIKAINGAIASELPNTPVVPFHRSDGSGDTFLFTSYLAIQSQSWNASYGYGTQVNWPASVPAARAVGNSTDMYNQCAQTPGCVGYDGVSYLPPGGAPLPGSMNTAMVQNGSGHYQLPDPANILAEVNKFVPITPASETISMIAGPGPFGYPLVNYEYAIVSSRQPDASRATLIKNFLTWAISDSTALQEVSGVGFVALPADIRTLTMQQIGKIG